LATLLLVWHYCFACVSAFSSTFLCSLCSCTILVWYCIKIRVVCSVKIKMFLLLLQILFYPACHLAVYHKHSCTWSRGHSVRLFLNKGVSEWAWFHAVARLGVSIGNEWWRICVFYSRFTVTFCWSVSNRKVILLNVLEMVWHLYHGRGLMFWVTHLSLVFTCIYVIAVTASPLSIVTCPQSSSSCVCVCVYIYIYDSSVVHRDVGRESQKQ
jgi:hypothetical protein